MGLMSDLKEFGQNFVLAAGAGIAKNIEERAKEESSKFHMANTHTG